jgi:hypothetical protein
LRYFLALLIVILFKDLISPYLLSHPWMRMLVKNRSKQAAGPDADCRPRRECFYTTQRQKDAVLTVSPIQAFTKTDDR